MQQFHPVDPVVVEAAYPPAANLEATTNNEIVDDDAKFLFDVFVMNVFFVVVVVTFNR